MISLSQTGVFVPSSAAARAKIEQALRMVGPARQDNAVITDVFESAHKLLEGSEPHVKAIEFDRPSRDVSEHGTTLRGQAARADQKITSGKPGQSSLESAAGQIEALIDGALSDLGKKNGQASDGLRAAKNDLDFARRNTISTTGNSLSLASRLLSGDLDPYLAEVEADEPGRDVGRFADDIDRLWKQADRLVGSGPIYTKSIDQSLEKVLRNLEMSRSAL